MAIKREVRCDRKGCTAVYMEEKYGDGFIGWGGIKGMQKDGQDIYLCPECLVVVLYFIDPDEKTKAEEKAKTEKIEAQKAIKA